MEKFDPLIYAKLIIVRATEHRFTVSAFNVVHHVSNKTFKVFCHPIVVFPFRKQFGITCQYLLVSFIIKRYKSVSNRPDGFSTNFDEPAQRPALNSKCTYNRPRTCGGNIVKRRLEKQRLMGKRYVFASRRVAYRRPAFTQVGRSRRCLAYPSIFYVCESRWASTLRH
jgi:hypothetical protein